MNPPIYLTPDQVPSTLRGSYTGKQFKAYVCESVTIHSQAGLWDGGSRDTFRAVRTVDGREVPLSDNQSAPWDRAPGSRQYALVPGVIVIEHSIFCGKDMGLTFYVHPSDAAAMLPAPVELDYAEKLVLTYTAGRKASYNGRDRYQMMYDDARYGYGATKDLPRVPSREDWEAAKARLIRRKFLNKAGAITAAGRNASNAR